MNKTQYPHVAANLATVRMGIRTACEAAGRDPAQVTLVAVSKKHPPAALVAAYQEGQRDFGENYAQEFAAKAEALAGRLPALRLHFIGHLQTNKARLVAGRATLIHTADRPRILRHLDRNAQKCEMVQEVLFEVHLSPEESKAGCRPEQLPELLEAALALPNLRPRGLMTMPPWELEPEAARPYFQRLCTLRDELRQRYALPDFDQLSMGMSNDYAVAVAEGATIVRIGTAIFGERTHR